MPHPRPISKKPVGQPTRGKTASNRLRRVDNFILVYAPSLLTRTDALLADAMFVDLGYGSDPRTTLESASRFGRVNPDLRVLGVEIDKGRVEAALPYANEKTFFFGWVGSIFHCTKANMSAGFVHLMFCVNMRKKILTLCMIAWHRMFFLVA
jgi:hypothetical protein